MQRSLRDFCLVQRRDPVVRVAPRSRSIPTQTSYPRKAGQNFLLQEKFCSRTVLCCLAELVVLAPATSSAFCIVLPGAAAESACYLPQHSPRAMKGEAPCLSPCIQEGFRPAKHLGTSSPPVTCFSRASEIKATVPAS